MPRPKDSSNFMSTKICSSGYYDTPNGCLKFLRWEGDYIVVRDRLQQELHFLGSDCAPVRTNKYAEG
jgi:hypothetical protein